MEEQIQEILIIMRALAEQSQSHDRQIAENSANIQLLAQVAGEQGGFIRQVAQSVETVNGTVQVIAERIEAMAAQIQTVVERLEDVQVEVRGLQTENRRILDILQRRED